MRARALVGAIVFSSLFALMLVVTQAGVLPAESVLVAVSAPQWSNFQPTGWVAGPATTCSIRVFDQDGLIAQGQYRKSTDGGTTWSAESSQGLIVVVDGLNTTGFLTVTNLIFPESQTANQNQIKFSIWNAFGVQMWSDAYSVLVDTGSPTSTVSTSGCYSSTWPGMIHGTAGDSGSGVSFVQIRLRRSDGQYYNGSSWQSSPVWLAATGTSNWSYAFAPQENSYTVFSRATDAVGQHQMTYGSSDFSYDVTAPQSGITTSGCFRADNWTGLIQGTSSDNLSGIASVHLTVHRASDGLYYNGATWGASPTWLPASGTINWSLPLVPSAQTTYTVRSRATDNCGNVQTTPAEASFTYDASSPQSAVQTSGCFNLNGWPGAIYGSASDALSGVAAVEITLRRASDSLYYNGSSWGASPTWLPASGTTSWSFAFTPTVDTVYTVNVRASDNCGNVQSSPSTGSFTYDATAPLSAITTAGCFNSWPVTIQGSASDNLSGLAAVQISLRRASDGRYYDGSSWQPGISWITVSGTALWSFSFAPTVETTYTVNSRATDNCENVQVVPAEATFVYDATAPQSNVLTSGCFNASGWLGTIRGSASDLLSGVHYVQITLQRAFDGLYYNGTSWGPTVTWLPVSGASTWSYPFMPPVESIYTVNSRAADNCGNVQTSYGTSTFSYDTTAPGAPFNLSVTPFGWSQTNAFTLTWNNPADLCGVVAAHFKWNSAPTSNSDVSPGSPVTGDGIHSIVNLSVPTEGAHKLYLWLQDAAGNLSFQNRNVTNEGAFKWDATPPTTYVETVTGTLGCAGWYTTSVQVELAAIDATSGVSATFWRQDGGSWQRLLGSSFAVTGEGPHDIEYYSVDLAGNIEDKHVLSPRIQIDTIPPTTQQPNYAGSPGHNDWYISPVSVALTAQDVAPGSGLALTYHQVNTGTFELGSTFNVITDGVHTIRYFSTDVACNREAVQTANTPLRIDKTPPTTSVRLDGLAGENGWFRSSCVTVTLLAADQTSGVHKLYYRPEGDSWVEREASVVTTTVCLLPDQREGIRTIEFYAADRAGNIEPRKLESIRMDFRAPGPIVRTPTVSPSNWTNTNCFTITWEASDNPYDISGIGGACYSFSEPQSPTAGTCVPGEQITSLPCIQVPAELGDGVHWVWVWLRDQAGNSDHRTSRVVTVRLDQTPPEVIPVILGNQCGAAGWYNSCVTVTLLAADVHSGMGGGTVNYRVDGGDWLVGSSYIDCRDGVHLFEYRATDTAGNVSPVGALTIKIDQTPPPMPIGLSVEPAGWSRQNQFLLRWWNPGDLSGLETFCYKQNSPPAFAEDGTCIEGVHTSWPISVTTEGEIPMYVWLEDKACNSGYMDPATNTLRYDGTAPTTTFSISGTLGGDGWYTSDVQVQLNATDLGSGWASSHYRIGDGSWVSGTTFTVAAEGLTSFSYYSVDNAGNAESPKTGSVKIDRQSPQSYAYGGNYSLSPSFTVYWNGSDAASGLACFDVQYRVGVNGSWQDWVTCVDPAQKSRLFTQGAAGKCYYFRSRARDRAGNIEAYPTEPDTYVCVDLIQNGGFEEPIGSEWEARWIPGTGQGGACPPVLRLVQSYTGGTTNAMVLGCPDQEDFVPFGTSMVCQSLRVPTAQEWPAPMLHFRYHMITYDVLSGEITQRFFDSFHVGVIPVGGIEPTYVFTDGNRTGVYGQRVDLGWRQGAVDLRPYAGQTIKVCLANVTRWDNRLNTWTFVDDVQLLNLEKKLHLPAVQRRAPAAGAHTKVQSSALQTGAPGGEPPPLHYGDAPQPSGPGELRR